MPVITQIILGIFGSVGSGSGGGGGGSSFALQEDATAAFQEDNTEVLDEAG